MATPETIVAKVVDVNLVPSTEHQQDFGFQFKAFTKSLLSLIPKPDHWLPFYSPLSRCQLGVDSQRTEPVSDGSSYSMAVCTTDE